MRNTLHHDLIAIIPNMANHADDKCAEMLNDACEAIEVENMKPVADHDGGDGDMQQTIILDAKREKALV